MAAVASKRAQLVLGSRLSGLDRLQINRLKILNLIGESGLLRYAIDK
jgi:hypothetical protein